MYELKIFGQCNHHVNPNLEIICGAKKDSTFDYSISFVLFIIFHHSNLWLLRPSESSVNGC